MWGLEDQQGRPHLARCPARPDPVHTHTCSVQMYSMCPAVQACPGNSQKEAQQTGMHGLHTSSPWCSVLAHSALLTSSETRAR